MDHTFKVTANWDGHSVACRIAQIIGSNPIRWDKEEPDGFPVRVDNHWILDSARDYRLHRIAGEEDAYRLSFRLETPEIAEALDGLCKYLESDLVFGK